jgi:hypothetical protein
MLCRPWWTTPPCSERRHRQALGALCTSTAVSEQII